MSDCNNIFCAQCSTLLHRCQPQISIRNPSKTDYPPKNFTFDAVYDENTQQKAFYEESCYDLVEGVMEGYNGTIFAYGQVNYMDGGRILDRLLACTSTTLAKTMQIRRAAAMLFVI